MLHLADVHLHAVHVSIVFFLRLNCRQTIIILAAPGYLFFLPSVGSLSYLLKSPIPTSFRPIARLQVLGVEALFEDHEVNSWNIVGTAIKIPRQGQTLLPTTSFIGYWFAWGAFYEESKMNEQQSP